jgi:hypothetical protein
MTWNYRVIKGKDRKLKGLPQSYFYGIFEVYYGEDRVPHSCTTEPIALVGETLEELKKDYEMVSEAFKQPVLEMEYFKKLEK